MEIQLTQLFILKRPFLCTAMQGRLCYIYQVTYLQLCSWILSFVLWTYLCLFTPISHCHSYCLVSGSVSPTFFFNFTLTIFYPSNFHVNFRISLSIFTRNKKKEGRKEGNLLWFWLILPWGNRPIWRTLMVLQDWVFQSNLHGIYFSSLLLNL